MVVSKKICSMFKNHIPNNTLKCRHRPKATARSVYLVAICVYHSRHGKHGKAWERSSSTEGGMNATVLGSKMTVARRKITVLADAIKKIEIDVSFISSPHALWRRYTPRPP